MYDIAIIGAGIMGTFIARELSKYKINIIIIEKENDVANGATMANSGIIYDGYHSKLDRMKGKLIPRGNELYDKVCEELDVPFKRIGSLVIGFNEEDEEKIKKLYKKGVENKVPGLKIINKQEVLTMEPNLNPDIKFALYSPTCGIISPFEMTVALAENAIDNGVKLLLNSEVTHIKKIDKKFKIIMKQKQIEAKYVINCAGIYADKINDMIATSTSFKITPKRGQYFVLDKGTSNLVNSVILQCKIDNEKGVLLIPTIHNNLMIGPGLEVIDDKEAIETTSHMLNNIRKKAMKTCNSIPFNQVIRSFSGLKAKVDTGDFIVEELEEVKGFINVAGTSTPGLTCAPAIAEYVVEIVRSIFEGSEEDFIEKEDFNPRRRKVIRFKELKDDEKVELIKKDSRYGRVVCRCQTVTEGEIVDAIHRNAGAATVKGIKKRIGTSMGRCQGGFCGPKIVEILSRELGKEMHEILYDGDNSYILTERE
ncbi:FAD/NAD(P)-binding oxidoreductase [Clostridium polyendosporum]|uniref:FAD/NAD(P)-binding oxidoreductase n=1 Tax=Clostridium polyendosporum TaxID=69208 RepID=A0A919S0W9_9CLOT|nr:NAD(P)/FAD-dependent oxidoreductase [Clostridium polyendosporum]GIM29246.1 FAD/NAD(P)-binding oxidoreductase [Clostridium polyendosporum]